VGPDTVLVDDQQVRPSKPAADIFLKSQKQLGVEPADEAKSLSAKGVRPPKITGSDPYF
jgi:hypothetical protein